MFATVRIGEEHLDSGFSCGEPALDRFFAMHALPNDRRGIGRTFVLERSTDDAATWPWVIGFHTLSMANAPARALPGETGAGLPRYPLPVALIGRLAVDRRAQGHGIGQRLLADALARVAVAGQHVACMGVIVDAKNAPAVRFYERFGFEVLDGGEAWPRRMYLPIATIVAG